MANAFVCEMRKNANMAIEAEGKNTERERIAAWIRSEFERTGKAKKDLAKALGLDNSAISRMLEGARDVKAHEMGIIEAFFVNDAEAENSDRVEIGVIDVRAGLGGGGEPIDHFESDGKGGMSIADNSKTTWGLPSNFVRGKLSGTPSRTKIIEVLGDSMAPALNPGDRVFIDLNHVVPSPPGIYAVWDGYGLVVKRIELVPKTDPPQVSLISENPRHPVYVVSLEDARIVGRVIGRVTVM